MGGMRVVKPGGNQCCFEQFPSPVLCHYIMSDHPSQFLTCNDQRLTLIPLCQGHLECIVCEVKCYPVWNTLITFDQLQNILIVIFDRDEEKRRRMAKKILEFCDRCCYWA